MLGCVDPRIDPLPEIEWEGEHLRAGGDLADACGGNLPYMDSLVGELQRRLWTPGRGVVEYYYFADGDLPARGHCEHAESPAVVGCTNENQQVLSREIPMEHELVHAVHAEVGLSHPFLEEGLAEYFGDDAARPGRGEPTGLPAQAMGSVEAGLLPLGWYALAGHFVSFLDRDLGTLELLARIDAVDVEASAAEVQAVLGVGIEGGFAAIERRYEAAPRCPQASYRNAEPVCEVAGPLFESCSAEWDAAPDIEINVECSGLDVLGPRDGEIWAYRTFEVSNAGSYRILSTAGSRAVADGLVIKRCVGGCEATPIVVSTWAEDDFLVPDEVVLEAGRYLVRITRPQEDPARVRIKFAGAGCE